MTNTINRAELTGIAAALINKYAQIATDSACSLSQIRKQLLFPEMQRDMDTLKSARTNCIYDLCFTRTYLLL
jgi:ribonuclease HI